MLLVGPLVAPRLPRAGAGTSRGVRDAHRGLDLRLVEAEVREHRVRLVQALEAHLRAKPEGLRSRSGTERGKRNFQRTRPTSDYMTISLFVGATQLLEYLSCI